MARLLLAALLSLWSTVSTAASCSDSSTLFQIRPQDTLLKNGSRTGPAGDMEAMKQTETEIKLLPLFINFTSFCNRANSSHFLLRRVMPGLAETSSSESLEHSGLLTHGVVGTCWNFVPSSPLVTQWFSGSNIFKSCCSFMLLSQATFQPERGTNLNIFCPTATTIRTNKLKFDDGIGLLMIGEESHLATDVKIQTTGATGWIVVFVLLFLQILAVAPVAYYDARLALGNSRVTWCIFWWQCTHLMATLFLGPVCWVDFGYFGDQGQSTCFCCRPYVLAQHHCSETLCERNDQ